MQQTAGRIKSDTTVRRELRRSLNSAASSLADKVLAKALSGDSTAQLAAVQLLALGLGRDSRPQ
jgi:hypothetical protein